MIRSKCMNIDELRDKIEALAFELDNVGGEIHNRSASRRARLILGEIKNATPQLRKDLVELDKK